MGDSGECRQDREQESEPRKPHSFTTTHSGGNQSNPTRKQTISQRQQLTIQLYQEASLMVSFGGNTLHSNHSTICFN